jgi:uncharacterized membrane protein
VLGKLWLLHHRFFSAVERFDGTLMGLNLTYLAFIAVIPFTSELLGDYDRDSTAVIVYAVSMAAVSITFQAQLVYADRHDLVRPELREVQRVYARPTNVVVFAAGRRIGDRIVSMRR